MDYTKADEVQLCHAIADEGCKKYDDLIHQLNALLSKYPGKDLAHKLYYYILKVVAPRFDKRPSYFMNRGIGLGDHDGYGQYRSIKIGVRLDSGEWPEVVIKYQDFSIGCGASHNYCWDMPEHPTPHDTADATMSDTVSTLKWYSTIISFVIHFGEVEEQLIAVEDDERKERIIKFSNQLELLRKL